MTNPEELPMQITLVQTEIEDAIREYVTRHITLNDDQQIDIDLKATRGADGYQAMIDIRAKGSRRQTAAKPAQAASAPSTKENAFPSPEKAPVASNGTGEVTVQVKRRGRPPKAAVAAAAAEAEPTPEASVETSTDAPVADQPEAADVAQSETEQADVQTEEDPIEEVNQTVADIAAETVQAEPEPEEETPISAAPRKSLFASVVTPTNN